MTKKCLALSWMGVWIALAGTPLQAEDPYVAIQTAFLREDFQQVVQLTESLTRQPGDPDPLLSFREPLRSSRLWLWYALSLERLQRVGEALHAIDRVKAGLSNLPSASATPSELDTVWPEVLFWDGEISRKGFKLVRARLAYQRLLSEFPTSPWRAPAQLGLGMVFVHQQAYDMALEQLQAAAQAAAPSSAMAHDALLLAGLCRLQLNQYGEAEVTLRHLVDELTPPPAASAEGGSAPAAQARWAAAGGGVTDAAHQTLRAQVLFYLGEALTGGHRFEEAVSVYRQAIDADPPSRWARMAQFGLGWSHFQQRRCRDSLQAFERYEAAGPHEADLPAQGSTGQAGDVGPGAQDLAPSRLELLFAKGRCLMELGQDAQAVACFEHIRQEDPEHTLAIDATLGLAEVFQQTLRLEEAMGLVDEVLRRAFDPEQLRQANFRLGSLYLAQGEATKALLQFQLAKDTRDPQLRQAALNGLGDAYVALGEFEEATGWYESVQFLASTSVAGLYATYQLARLTLQAGGVQEAIERFQWLANQQSDQHLETDARLALAFAYLSNGQPALAQQELQRLHAQDPRSMPAIRAKYYEALLVLHEGRFSEAQRLCEEVIDRVPQSDEALEARLLLADLMSARSSPQEALGRIQESMGALERMPVRHRGRLAKKLGDLARHAEQYAQAVHWYELAWESLPAQRGELDYRLASCYEEVGDLAVAAHRYRAITRAPWSIRGQLATAKLMEREERWREAVAIYELLTRQPVPEAKIARERLSLLEQAQP